MIAVCQLCRGVISAPSVPPTEPVTDGLQKEWALFGHAVGQHFDQYHKKTIQSLMSEWSPFGVSLMGIQMLCRTTTTDSAFAERMAEARQKLHQVVDLAFGVKAAAEVVEVVPPVPAA